MAAGALVPAAALHGCGGKRPAFTWEQTEVSVGQVFRHSGWTGRVGWEIVGHRPVEVLGLSTQCGCLRAEACLEDGSPLNPGVYAPGTRGEVVLRVRPTREPRKLHEAARMVWCYAGEEEQRVSDLHVYGEVLDAWTVEPASVQLEEAPPGEDPEITVRWNALVDVVGIPEMAFEGTAALIEVLQDVADGRGKRVVTLRGRLLRPEEGYSSRGRIRLLGLDPPAPPVAVRATFARSVTVSPERAVSFTELDGSGFGTAVLLRATPPPGLQAGFSPRVEIGAG